MATGKALRDTVTNGIAAASDTSLVEQIMVLAHRYGPLFHLPQSKPRTLVVSTLALVGAGQALQALT